MLQQMKRIASWLNGPGQPCATGEPGNAVSPDTGGCKKAALARKLDAKFYGVPLLSLFSKMAGLGKVSKAETILPLTISLAGNGNGISYIYAFIELWGFGVFFTC